MKLYILTMVNAWTELVFIHHFTTLELAQEAMRDQVNDELSDGEPYKYDITEKSAYFDTGEFDDRVTYQWDITEVLV